MYTLTIPREDNKLLGFQVEVHGAQFWGEHWVDYSFSVLRPQYSESHMNACLLHITAIILIV